MKILYFDCFAGISADMAVGAMLDLGVDLQWLTEELNKLNICDYSLTAVRTEKRGISGISFTVVLPSSEATADGSADADGTCQNGAAGALTDHQSYDDVRRRIIESELSETVKTTALRIFHRVARAEAKIRGNTLESVHFHEISAVDSIINIVGVALCIDALGVDRIYCSPVHTGSGFIRHCNGILPVPSPSTLEIFTESDLHPYSTHLRGQFTTPTGAAILAETAIPVDGLPPSKIIKVGYGAGSKDYELPNMLRAILADHADTPDTPIWQLEANIDDSTGEILGYALERLMDAGALDVYYTPIFMKKGRPGILLTVLCTTDLLSAMEYLILTETSTLGLRRQKLSRTTFSRHSETVESPWGPVSIKVSHWNESEKITPEYEDCKRIARAHGLPLQQVMATVMKQVLSR